MVGFEAPVLLAALSNPMAYHHLEENLMRMNQKPNLASEVNLRWAGSRETSVLRPRRSFFLDIPFYRTR
jgi:hypothetical protein